MQGPDIAEQLAALTVEKDDVADVSAFVPLPQRMEQLRAWVVSRVWEE